MERWTWTDAWTFIALFVGIRIAFIWLATKAFIAMIPDGDCCLMCDGHTLPIQRDGWWKILGPRFRRSWCLDCGWEGGAAPERGAAQAASAAKSGPTHRAYGRAAITATGNGQRQTA